eukprot:COSAG05_NODE_711_length_7822_cov_11.919720_10_plen_46_part_00
MRLTIIGNERIKIVCKSQLCMVDKLPIIFKRTYMHYTTGAFPYNP